MSASLFLFGTHVIVLDESNDPLADEGFPLSAAQFAVLTAEALIAMVCDDVARFPDLPEERPDYLAAIAHLLVRKAGVNAVRPEGGEWGPGARWGRVPDGALAALAKLEDLNALTPGLVDEALWQRLN